MLPPLVFEPYFRQQVWGGTRLQRLLGKRLPLGQRIGESWEVSGHPQHVSRVAEGNFAGASLAQLWGLHRREFLGLTSSQHDILQDRRPFPLLVKLLDCHDTLSVQVHPNDHAARELLGESNGKTEAWVVLHSEPGSRIYAGLKEGIRRRDLEEHLDRGTVAECLHSFEPQPGDCLLIEAGTVHAIGGGVLLAEVQQTSDATFRLFDWNRLDARGLPRELHREAALECIDFDSAPVPVVRAEDDNDEPHFEEKTLIACDYFGIDAIRICGVSRPLGLEPMTIWLVTSGIAQLIDTHDDHDRSFAAGECVLIPADSSRLEWFADDARLIRIEPFFDAVNSKQGLRRTSNLVAVG
jgi:mannose-6-phosphate isomerase